jgi:PAS domain S-box-containing protein
MPSENMNAAVARATLLRWPEAMHLSGPVRLLLAVLLPVLALALQLALWEYIKPLVWVLFYPAVLISAWLGGVYCGLFATVLSAALVVNFFLQAEYLHDLANPRQSLNALAFVCVGVMISVIQGRIGKLHRSASESARALAAANAELDSRVLERTAELAHANEALKAGKAQLESVFASLAEGVVVLNLAGEFVHLNRAAMEMRGMTSAADYLGKQSYLADTFELETLDGASLPVDQWPSARIVRGEPLRDHELRVRRIATGRERIFSYSGNLVRDENGTPLMGVMTMRDVTEYRQLEDDRAGMEAHFHAVFDVMPDAIIVTDLARRIVTVNAAAVRLFGFSEDELLGMNIGSLVPTSNRDDMHREREHLVGGADRNAAGQTWQLEARRKDGSTFPLEVRRSALSTPRGNFVVGAVRDITQRQREEAARSELEMYFRGIFEQTPDYLTLAGADGIIVMANPAAEATFGYAPGTLVGMHVRALTPAAVSAELEQERSAMLKNNGANTAGKLWQVDARKQDGTIFPVEFRRSVLWSARGPMVLGVGRDISARLQAEAARGELEAYYQAIFDLTPDAIIVSDENRRIVTSNLAAQRNLGYSATELLGVPLESLILVTDPDAMQSDRNSMIESADRRPLGKTWQIAARRKDGTTYPVEIRRGALESSRGKFVIGVARDISERLKTEAERTELEDYFRAVFDVTPDSIMLTNETGHIVAANLAAVESFGYLKEELLGMHISLLAPTVNRGEMQRNRDELLGKPGNADPRRVWQLEGKRKDGSVFPQEVRRSALNTARGTFFIGVGRDISERLNAEAARAELEAHFRTIFDFTPDAIVLADEQWEFIVNANAAAEAMFGYEPGELLGKSMDLLLPGRDKAKLSRERTALMNNPDPVAAAQTREVEGRRKDGSKFPIELRRTVLVTARGKFGLGIGRDISERRRAETARAELEAYIQGIFQEMPDFLVLADADGNIVMANPAADRALGYAPGELVGRHVRALSPPVERNKLNEERPQLLRQTIPDGKLMQTVGQRADGTTFPAELCRKVVRTPRGPMLLTIGRDIRERLQAESARTELEAMFRAIFDETPDCVILADKTGTIVMANPSAARMFGYPDDSMVGISIGTLMPFVVKRELGDERSQLLNSSAEHAAGNLWQTEARRMDGTTFPIEIRRSALVTARGPLVLGVGRDVSERVRAEQARARLASIVEFSEDAIIGKDLDGKVFSWNRGAEKIFGYTADEMIGQSITRIVPPEGVEEEFGILEKVKHGESVEHYDVVRKTKDGRPINISISVSPIRDAAGNVTGASKIARDVTQTRTLEAQLRQSQKMEAIGMLASGIAHDFNNIIGAMLGNIELARQDIGDNSHANASLDEIRKAARRARDLVQQILAFGRRQPTARAVISLAGAVEEAVRLLRSTLPPRLSLASSVDADTPNVLADSTQIQQVLLNLGTNAAHAMTGQAGRIDVHARAVTLDAAAAAAIPGLRPGRYAQVIFTDTGHGMNAETLTKIFEPFFTTKAKGEGTGLGMSVVQGIMRDHEGAITVRSAPGKGTTFELYFPDARAEVIAEAVPVAAPAVDGLGRRVLYIDDDEAMLFLVKRMLGRHGYQVTAFVDAAEGLRTLRADPTAFDLALTDHNMPGMSGIDVAREIRALRPDLPVALASGYISDDIRTDAIDAGVREIIFKPDMVEEFCEMVQRLAQRSTETGQTEAVAPA